MQICDKWLRENTRLYFKQQIKVENKPKSSKQNGNLGSGLKSKEIKKLIKESKK